MESKAEHPAFFQRAQAQSVDCKGSQASLRRGRVHQVPYRREHEEPVRRLLAVLRSEYDAKDPKFQRRHPAVVKAHMLMLAQACRLTDAIDASLEADLKLVMAAMPRLWDEALKLAFTPYNQLGYSYLRPVLSFLEFAPVYHASRLPSIRRGENSERSCIFASAATCG